MTERLISVVRAVEIINSYFNVNIDPRGDISEVQKLTVKYNTEEKLKNYLKNHAFNKILDL